MTKTGPHAAMDHKMIASMIEIQQALEKIEYIQSIHSPRYGADEWYEMQGMREMQDM